MFRCSFVLLFALVLIYTNYFSDWVNGRIVSAAINLYLGTDRYISIGSFSVGFLGGRLLFEDVQYITEDFSVKAIQLSISIKWWSKTSGERMSMGGLYEERVLLTDSERLSISLYGVEILLFNAQSKYEALEELAKQNERAAMAEKGAREKKKYGDSSDDEADHRRVNMGNKSTIGQSGEEDSEHGVKAFFYELFPVVGYWMKHVRVMIGNPALEKVAFLKATSGSGDSKIQNSSFLTSFSLFDRIPRVIIWPLCARVALVARLTRGCFLVLLLNF